MKTKANLNLLTILHFLQLPGRSWKAAGMRGGQITKARLDAKVAILRSQGWRVLGPDGGYYDIWRHDNSLYGHTPGAWPAIDAVERSMPQGMPLNRVRKLLIKLALDEVRSAP
jgi:hypothetical protein